MMRAILWCNGENPNLNMISKLLEGATLFGVDGGADKAIAAGFEVTEVLGGLFFITTLFIYMVIIFLLSLFIILELKNY